MRRKKYYRKDEHLPDYVPPHRQHGYSYRADLGPLCWLFDWLDGLWSGWRDDLSHSDKLFYKLAAVGFVVTVLIWRWALAQ